MENRTQLIALILMTTPLAIAAIASPATAGCSLLSGACASITVEGGSSGKKYHGSHWVGIPPIFGELGLVVGVLSGGGKINECQGLLGCNTLIELSGMCNVVKAQTFTPLGYHVELETCPV